MKKIKTYENLEDKSTEISGITTGTVLTIEGQEYIVIENVQGNQYKVLSSDAVWKRFDDNRSNNYATSTIADYLDNDYYNNLPESIKNAVVKTPIQQTELNTYAFINPTNWGEKTDAGTHKVFIPSWDEVTKVYGTSHYKLKAYAPDSWTWLRDIYSNDVLIVDRNGILDNSVPHINLYVRPAFVIDLSKVKNKEYKTPLQKDDIEFLAPLLIPYTGVPATMKKILTTVPCLNGAVTEFYVLHIENKIDGCPLAIIPLMVATPDFDLLDTNIQYELDIKALLKEYINSKN